MATARPFVVDSVLTAIALGYRNTSAMLIADRVLPRVPVGGDKFKWLEYPMAEAFTAPDSFVGRKGLVNQVEFTATERTDSVDDHAFDDVIPNTDIDAAAALRDAGRSTYNPEGRAIEGLTDLLMIRRELRVATLVTNLSTYPASQRATLSGTSQWSDYANSNPLTALLAALDTPIYRPNKIIMGQAAWTATRQHPRVVNAVKGGNLNSGAVSREQLAEQLEVEEIIIGSGWLNTAVKGQAANMQRIWGKDCALIYQNAVAGPETGVTFGFTAEFESRVGGRYDDPKIGINGGVAVRSGERVKEIIAAPAAGYLFKNAVA